MCVVRVHGNKKGEETNDRLAACLSFRLFLSFFPPRFAAHHGRSVKVASRSLGALGGWVGTSDVPGRQRRMHCLAYAVRTDLTGIGAKAFFRDARYCSG